MTRRLTAWHYVVWCAFSCVVIAALAALGCESSPPLTVIDNSLYVKELEATNKRQGETIRKLVRDLNEARGIAIIDPELAGEHSVLVEKPPDVNAAAWYDSLSKDEKEAVQDDYFRNHAPNH